MNIALLSEAPPKRGGDSARTSMLRALHSRMIDLTEVDLGMYEAEWAHLVSGNSFADPFVQPYWMLSFARTFGRASTAVFVLAHEQEKLQGILALMRAPSFFRGFPARTLRSLTGAHSCRFDLICNPDEAEIVARSVWGGLRDDETWDVIEALHVPLNGNFGHLMHQAALDGFLVARWPTYLSPYLELPQGASDPFRNCPSKYSKNRARLKKCRTKLESLGAVEIVTETSYSEEFVSSFIELEGSGWKGRNGGAIKCSPDAQDFYRRALKGAASVGHLRMHALNLEGRPIAMEIGLQVNGSFFSPKVAYDESFAQYSPGQALMVPVLAQLHADGIRCYDFLGPRARHKYVWTNEVREHGHCYIFRPSLKGRSSQALVSRIGPAFRRLKHAIYGDSQSLGSTNRS